MDPISFTVGILGLTGLFSVCLDVIERVDSYKDFGVDSRAIIAQFEADKHLFTKWAKDVGLSGDKPKKNCHKYLDDPETHLIVQKILLIIQEIFSKTAGTMSNLQPVAEAGPTSLPDSIRFFNTRQNSQKFEVPISKRSRIGWSLRCKARFISQVQQFGALVQKLYSLVPPDGLRGPVNLHKDTTDKAISFPNSQQLLIEMEKQNEYAIRKELDNWLGTSWTNDIYDNFIRRRLDGTCDWILTRQAFRDWVSPDFSSGTAKFLWINGCAGYGKTILCARVVEHLLLMLQSPVAYYFCSSDSESRRDPLNIMRSWISQVISYNRDVFELACGRWETKDGRYASQTDIVDLFKTIVEHVRNCTFVVDGLDECAWAEEKWKYIEDDSPMGFFESMKRAVAHTTTRVLILSRDEPEIRYSLYIALASDSNHGLDEYRIRPDDVRSDAMLLSRSIVNRKLANKSEILKTELSQRITDRCEGMFLWVKMLEEQLRGGKNKKQLEETIDQTPVALEHLYDRNWARISHLPGNDRLRAFSILRWATFALRPLTILELTEALIIVDDDCEDLLVDELPDTIDEDYIGSEILGLCGSLLETQKPATKQDLGSMTIHLAHFSIKQYVLCNMPAQGGLLMVNEELRSSNEAFQNNTLAKLCLRYLSYRSIWQESLPFQGDPGERPFREYAAGSWHQHSNETGSNYREVVGLTNVLFSSKNKNWESWKEWFDANDDKSTLPESQRMITSTNPLFYASLLGLRDTVIYLLEEVKLGVNHVDEFNRTALQAAALKGRTSIVKLLLDGGADLAVANQEGWTPLNAASDSGYVEVVQLLLKNGADETVTTNNGWTPLNSASHSGHFEVVQLLLENGADVTVANNNGWTPLNSASNMGHVRVVQLLLEKGADVTVANNDRWTPLNVASNNGHTKVVQLLLEKGADVTIASNEGWTPLNSASDSGHVEIVQLLLEKGADVTVANNNGCTPLNLASDKGHVEVARLLLEKGADMTLASNEGWTPLNSASDRGHVEIVQLLLEKGADVTFATNEGITPLGSASKSGHAKVVQLLLENGADVTVADNEGITPLSFASCSGHTEVVQLLLENNADETVATNNGWTPLNLASDHGHVEVVQLLLENGADMTVANNNGWTPLSSASMSGHVKVVQLLLENGADVTVADNEGITPLSFASFSGHNEVVQMLLKNNADVNVATNKGWTPLNLASDHGHVEIVQLLLENGADMTVANNNGWTALNSASDKGHVKVARLLLEKGANVTIASNDGWTPLNSASDSGHVEIVQLLLEKGADVTVANNNGCTPLNLASDKGHVEVARLLLEKGADMMIASNEGWTPLNSASDRGHVEIVQLLLEKGADMTIASNEGWTPLNSASDSGHVEVVQLLLERGADVTFATNEGITPLRSASNKGHVDVIKLLLNNGAEVDCRNREIQNALQAAASKGSHSLMQMFIEKSKDIDLDIHGNVFQDALHHGCIQGHITVVEQLIDRGVNPSQADEHGWTPLLCASWFGQGQILDFLSSKTADKDSISPIKTVPPSSWSIVDKSTCLELDESLTCVRYINDIGTVKLPAAMVLANHPVPLRPDGYYYEIKVLSSGDTGEIGLGFCNKYAPLDSFPGWNYASWGYHGDDGKKFFQSAGTPYGPTFKSGDVIGCKIHLKGDISFTLNGASLGVAFQNISGKLYPAVGMRSRGAHVQVNFGQEAFTYCT